MLTLPVIGLVSLYLYAASAVAAGLFSEDKSLIGLLALVFLSVIWPITLFGMAMFKLARFLNKLP